jgi:hypothetical protein
MDREPEDHQFLGVMGISGEAFKILRSYAKLLGTLTLTLVLPLSFAILGHNLVSDYLLYEIRWNEIFYQVEAGTPAAEKTMRELTWEWTELFVFLAAYALFVFAFSLLSTAAVVYTVASIYTGKEVSYARVMSVVPKVWKRLMLTFLWFFLIVIVYYTASISALFLLMCAVGVDKLNSGVFHFGLILIFAVFFCVHVYISMVWHLACVISVLEERNGPGALWKSKNLIKGKRITALLLDILYLIFTGLIGWFFGYAVVHGDRHGVGRTARGLYGGLLVGSLCLVNLMGLLTQSVFYFVCKSYSHESIDKSSLSDHLEVYLGDYVPLMSSSIQLEAPYGTV